MSASTESKDASAVPGSSSNTDTRTMEEVQKDIIIDAKLNQLVDPSVPQHKLNAIKERAKQLIEQKDKEDVREEIAGLKEAGKFIWAVGLPPVQEYLSYIVNASESSQDTRVRVIKKIDKLLEKRGIVEQGYMRYFFDDAEGKRREARFTIKLCDRDYDLSHGISKLQASMDDSRKHMPAVKHSLSTYIAFVRRAFTQVIAEEQKLAESIRNVVGPEIGSTLLSGLKVSKDTTLYLIESTPKHLGIFIEII